MLKQYSIKFIALICLVIMFNILVLPRISYAATYSQIVRSGIGSFPVEYQEYLNNLRELHPNWTFDAYYTGISWSDFLANETDHSHNRIIASSDPSWKCSCGNVASGYACASSSIISYYADPRNFLNEINVFQFLEISYNSNVHTLSGIEAIIRNTFMNTRIQCTNKAGQNINMTYAEIILDAAKKSNMSPYSIATKIIQEVGSNGSSSITGTVPGYEGFYNFYNYGAYDSGNAIANGLQYAKTKGWNNQYDAIVEGACLLADSYTNAGQNTAYFYKWDVVGSSILKAGYSQNVTTSNLFRHQYMTNVQDPNSQSNILYNTYVKTNAIDGNLNFIIPVYNDMPSTNKIPSELTDGDGELHYVNCTDGLFVRSAPNTSGTILATLYKDTTVAVLQKDCSTDSSGRVWSKVKLSSGIIGYTASQYLTPSNSNNYSESTESVIATAHTTYALKLRSSATTSSVMLLLVPEGGEVSILQKDVAYSDGYTWHKVKYNNTTGYVARDYLTDITGDNNNSNSNQSDNTSVEKSYSKIDGDKLLIVPGATLENIENASGEIKTGSTITKDGIQYTAVVLGDVNGDGKINTGDTFNLKTVIMNISQFNSEACREAADINRDNKINTGDSFILKKHVVNIENISL